jgi:hypothetical protein
MKLWFVNDFTLKQPKIKNKKKKNKKKKKKKKTIHEE